MLLKNEAKVGLLVFAALVAFIAAYWFLRGFGLGAHTFSLYAIFDDAKKLDKGADVRMAGVKVGYVDTVVLTSNSQARVDMKFWDDTCIPQNSIARVTTGAFIGDYYVDVLPGTKRACLKDGQKISSSEPVNYDKLISNVSGLIDELKVSVASINSVLADKQTVQSFKNTVKQLDAATKSAVELVDSVKGTVKTASPGIQRTLDNMAAATGNAVKMTEDLRAMLNNEARPDVHAILAKANQVMSSLDATILEAKNVMTESKGVVGGFKQTGPKIDATLTKLDDAMQQTDEMMKNLKDASGDIKDITSDKELKQNIKDTIKNAAAATAQANALLCNLNKKLGGLKMPVSTRKAEIPNYGLTTDSLWNTTQGKYRFDANYTLGGFEGSDMFYRLGAFNIGEDTSANIQAGKLIGSSTAVRGGIYASRLGFGLDQKFGRNLLISADGLRPNDPEYDLRAMLNFGSGFGLYGGYSNIINEKPDTFVGVHYSR